MKMTKPHMTFDRTYHFKPSDQIKFCQPEFKGLLKRYTPADNDVVKYVKTEKVQPNSHYTDNFSGKVKVKNVNPNTRKVNRKPNEIEISEKNYVPNPRRMNKPVQIDKQLHYTHYQIQGINPKDDDFTLKRKLRKQGVDPADLVVLKDPITHLNKGIGVMALNTQNYDQRDKQIEKVSQLGIKTTPVKNHNRKMI